MTEYANLSAIRQNFANVVYTKTMHEICKEREMRKRNIILIADIIFVFLTLATIIFQVIVGEESYLSYLGMLFSVLAITLLLVKFNFDPSSEYKRHERAANDLYEIRERYICLMADVVGGQAGVGSIANRRDELIDATKRVYETAPFKNRRAFRKAQIRLRGKEVSGEDFTFSDDEIDHFLPSDLQYAVLRRAELSSQSASPDQA